MIWDDKELEDISQGLMELIHTEADKDYDEVRSDSDFENRILDHLIDKRYDMMKSTVIISNDTVESFEKQIGPSICDRIRETGGIAEMKWQSFRGKVSA